MFDNSMSKVWAIWALALFLIGASAWYGISSDSPGDATNTQRYATFPAAQDEPARNAGKTSQVDPAKANPALASPFEVTARDPASSKITGRWVGVVDVGDGNRLQFSFNFREKDGQLSGTATFPIGEGKIEDGKINADRLSFATRHSAPLTGNPLVTRFTGTLSDRGLKLIMLSEGGESHLKLDPVSR